MVKVKCQQKAALRCREGFKHVKKNNFFITPIFFKCGFTTYLEGKKTFNLSRFREAFWIEFVLFHFCVIIQQKFSQSRVSLSSCLFLMLCSVTAQRSQSFNGSFCSYQACVEISLSSLNCLMVLCNTELKLISTWSSPPNSPACLGCSFYIYRSELHTFLSTVSACFCVIFRENQHWKDLWSCIISSIWC